MFNKSGLIEASAPLIRRFLMLFGAHSPINEPTSAWKSVSIHSANGIQLMLISHTRMREVVNQPVTHNEERQPYLDCVGEGVDCTTTGIWGLLGCDLYTRKPKIPHTNGAKKRGNSSVINCSNAKSESPINPKIYPTTLVAENSFLVFDITRSMRN